MDYRTRDQWGATYDPSQLATITLPRSLIFIHHDVIPPTGDPNADMEKAEQTDIARFGKPSYKWAVHPSGVVLEGMTNHVSPDTIGHNSDLSIMFMGNFEQDQPTDAAMQAGRELVAWLRANGYAAADAQILGHRDVYATACPGANLYPRIQELATPGDDMPLNDTDKQFIDSRFSTLQTQVAAWITDSENRQNAALPALVGATVAATVKATATGTVDPAAIASAVVAEIADKLK